MGVVLQNGAPKASQDYITRMGMENTRETRVEFQADTLVTDSIKTDYPLKGMWLYIRGQYQKAGVNAPTLVEGGLFNLLRKFEVHLDGSDTRMSVRGRHLPYIHRLYSPQVNDPYRVEIDPAAATWEDFFVGVWVPFDIGSYFSLLDASNNKSIDVHYTCGSVSDCVTGGDGGSLQNVTFEVVPVRITGGLPSEHGGKGFPGYGKLHLTYSSKPIEQDSSDSVLDDMLNGRGFIGLTMFATDAGVLSDSIINSIELVQGNRRLHKWHRQEMQAIDYDRYNLSAAWTGVYNVPFADPGHLEHALSIRSDQTLRLIGDVTKGTGATRVEVLEHYLKA